MTLLGLMIVTFFATIFAICFYKISFRCIGGKNSSSLFNLDSCEIILLTIWTVIGIGIDGSIGYGISLLIDYFGFAFLYAPLLSANIISGYIYKNNILVGILNIKNLLPRKPTPLTIEGINEVLAEIRLLNEESKSLSLEMLGEEYD